MKKLRPTNHFDFKPMPPEKMRLAGLVYDNPPYEAHQSSRYFVQLFKEAQGVVRITVNRVEYTLKNGSHHWMEGISWDDLQKIKALMGFGDRDAVEVFPADHDVVNVANMRHLWVLPGKLSFCWRNNETEERESDR